jgi:hypothetical protein
MNKKLLTLASLLLGAAGLLQAQIVVTNTNTAYTVDFDSQQAGITSWDGGGSANLIEPGRSGIFEQDGIYTSFMTAYHNSANAGGQGNGVVGWFGDGNNDGDVEDIFGSAATSGWSNSPLGYTGRILRVTGVNDYDTERVYFRIQNNTGATVTDWTISYDLYGADADAAVNHRSTLLSRYAVSNLVNPGDMTFTTVDTYLMSNTGSTTALSLDAAKSLNFTASVASGDYLVFALEEVNSNSGSAIYIDNLSVTAIPEPGTLALLGIALGSLLLFRRRK